MSIRFLVLFALLATLPRESNAVTPSPVSLGMWTAQCERELARRETGEQGDSQCTMYVLGAFAGAGEAEMCRHLSIRGMLGDYIAFTKEYDQSASMSAATRDFVLSSCAKPE